MDPRAKALKEVNEIKNFTNRELSLNAHLAPRSLGVSELKCKNGTYILSFSGIGSILTVITDNKSE